MESDLELADDSERRYKTNFLMRVIFRIDFTKALEDSKIKRSKFENGIREIFKTPEIQKLKVLEATISDKLTASKVEDVDSYVFLDEKKVRKLTVAPMALILELAKYANFSDLFKTIELVLSEFMGAYDKVVAKRMGLRYINAITIKEGDPLDWHNLIANDLTSTIAFLKDKSKLSRVMNTIELNKSDRKIIFRFGLFNSEYPNTIARKEFILDYDCYTDDEKEIDQIADLIREFHDEIVKLFEASIRDNLREMMGEVKNGLP